MDFTQAIGYVGRTPEEILGEARDRVLRSDQQRGVAPETLGVTRPMRPVSDSRSVLEDIRGWVREQFNRKGGGSLDGNDTPVEQGYAQKRYQFIANEEATRRYAYDDATGKQFTGSGKKGNVTVGIGFNMDRPDARRVMSRALGVGDADFDAIYKGQRPLTPEQIRRLFEYNAEEAESVVDQRFKGANLTEHQRLALVSMAFNGPTLLGQHIVNAVKSSDSVTALKQILFGSNRSKKKGIASRRYREAAMFAGSGDSGVLPSFKEYMAAFS